MLRWRRHLHANPETAFREFDTAAFVAGKLRDFGFAVSKGIAGTGVVGTLATAPGPAIALRADMDALPIEESNDIPHRSTRPGAMHACGHDGHTAMLLGAAACLAETRRFRGTLHVIFQPAEENEAGGRAMVEEGLFERFPVEAVFGLHNWPGLPAGRIAVRAGPVMAACDLFEISIAGAGCHAAMPHLGRDPIVCAAAMTMALQTVVSRRIDPLAPAVVSVTQLVAGETWNAIPDQVVVRGTTRAFSADVQDAIEASLRQVAAGMAAAHGCDVDITYRRQYPATVNHPLQAEAAAAAAAAVVGAGNVDRAATPSMGAEDFAFMLQRVPGAYVWLGSGRDGNPVGLHHPRYDFNDAVLPLGAHYWVTLVEQCLSAR
jgi:hippurate hydrolase